MVPRLLAEEGEADVFGDFGSVDLEGIASGRFGLGGTGFRHSGFSFYFFLLSPLISVSIGIGISDAALTRPRSTSAATI